MQFFAPKKDSNLPVQILAWGFIGLIVILFVIFAPHWIVSAGDVPAAAKRLELQNSVRGTLLQGAAGTLFLVTASIAYHQFRVAKRQTEIAGTDLDSKIVTQLGDAVPEIRVAGVIEMGRSVQSDPKDAARVLDILEVFVKRSSPLEQPPASLTEQTPPMAVRRPDVQEALQLFAQLRPTLPYQDVLKFISDEISLSKTARPHFQSVDLRGADLKHGNLQLCDFQGSSMRRSNLSRANMSGSNLSGTDLFGALLSLADFSQCFLLNANLDSASSYGADFTFTVLSGASLKGADLRECTFGSAYLEEVTLQIDWVDPTLGEMDHRSLDFRRRQTRQTLSVLAQLGFLSYEVFTAGPIYPAADLSGADIRGANLSGAALTGAVLAGAQANMDTRWPPGFDPAAAGVVFS
ncbi:pentapeptide repeat-containing protein [Streptomyces sp. NPDC029041]|uniref:pentapeptide repeat-containing protein n=1 Tax=Streptomyces sp. NPDC029041 TaxID=3155727 RepID=UPI00340B2E41